MLPCSPFCYPSYLLQMPSGLDERFSDHWSSLSVRPVAGCLGHPRPGADTGPRSDRIGLSLRLVDTANIVGKNYQLAQDNPCNPILLWIFQTCSVAESIGIVKFPVGWFTSHFLDPLPPTSAVVDCYRVPTWVAIFRSHQQNYTKRKVCLYSKDDPLSADTTLACGVNDFSS